MQSHVLSASIRGHRKTRLDKLHTAHLVASVPMTVLSRQLRGHFWNDMSICQTTMTTTTTTTSTMNKRGLPEEEIVPTQHRVGVYWKAT